MIRFLSFVLLAVITVACGSSSSLPPPSLPLTPPLRLCTERTTQNCREPKQIESWMRRPDLRLVDAANTPAGTQGAKVVTLLVPDGRRSIVFRAKWRPYSTADLINDPRKELGAYAVQQLFLKPHDYVIPPTAGHCFKVDEYRQRVLATAHANFERTDCVYGILSYWLPDAEDVEDATEEGILDADGSLYDEELYRESLTYRRSLVHLNIAAFLVNHGDAHAQQFLVVDDSHQPRVYSVDNTIAFRSIPNPMLLFREDWSTLRVTVVPTDTKRRILAIDEQDLGALSALEEYELVDGQLVHRKPKAAVRPNAAMRWVGDRLQVGLTADEIDGVRKRVDELKRRIR